MLYVIKYEMNGREGEMNVRAESDEEAIAKFKDDFWTNHADQFTGSCWITERYSVGGFQERK